MPPPYERTGVLVIRAWIEPEGDDGLRARITYTLDLSHCEQSTVAVATCEGVAAAVLAWLDALVADAE